ncbi:MAG: pirin family protein [Planctomycetota bacterium]
MLTLRKADDRGTSAFAWLDSRHSFSFGRYQDPEHTGFGPLLVLNDDRVTAGGGFSEHGHDNMEILSWVMDGVLEHRDSTGSHGILRHGTLQRMSAGTGIRHSEFNHSKSEPVRFLQIWIVPDKAGHDPRYDDRHYDPESFRNQLRLIAAPATEVDPAEPGTEQAEALSVHQNARVLVTRLDAGKSVTYAIGQGRRVWVQVALGTGTVNGTEVSEGDGVALTGESLLDLSTSDGAEFLVFDIAE